MAIRVVKQPWGKKQPYNSRKRRLNRDSFNRLVSAFYLDSEMSSGPFYGSASDYEFYMQERFVSGPQILNRGLVVGVNLTLTRNAVEFDGLTNAILTAYQPGATSTVEAVLIPTVTASEDHYFGNSDFLCGQNAAGNALLTYGGVTAVGAAVTTSVEQTWKIIATDATTATLYIDGNVAASVTTGAYSLTEAMFIGASNDGAGAAQNHAQIDLLRCRAWDGAVLGPDWRCRTGEVDETPAAEKLIDDNGGTYTVDNALTPGAISVTDLGADVVSAYDCCLE
ncbi:MAG: hypothetical protein JRD89_12245, partial [Deltaproteobacteria bacterium]|nr:hypothetical protein [Deltaproteobacteria bacterium]